jgi:integrase
LKLTIRLAARGAVRERRPKSSRAVTADILDKLLAACQGDSLRGLRDQAILMVAFASGGRRRSEIATLRCEQIAKEEPHVTSDGARLPKVSIRLDRPDTSGGNGAQTVYLVGRPVEILAEWLRHANIKSGSVFRGITPKGNLLQRGLDPRTINDIVKRRVAAAGLDPSEFTAHGIRSGYLRDAGDRGIPLAEAMEQSRHRSVKQASRYYNSITR